LNIEETFQMNQLWHICVYTHLEAGNIKEQFFNMAQSKQYNFYSLDRAPAVVSLNNEDYNEEPEPDFSEEADDED